MQTRVGFWLTDRLVLGGIILCATLVAGGLYWRRFLTALGAGAGLSFRELSEFLPTTQHPLVEALKLASALLIGILVTAVLRRLRPNKRLSVSMEQTQILLCVAGALMMIIIGNSLARAFGVAGAATIVRFRTPVDDPKDTIGLFLVLGLGMACGLGAFAMAGLGTAFLCLSLVLLDRIAEKPPRPLLLTVAAGGGDSPAAHVQEVFARLGVHYEPREGASGEQTSLRYRILLPANLPPDKLGQELRGGGASGVHSVSWEPPKDKKDKKRDQNS